jgi:glycosyltransferase involved in cell wall biosynthesis
VKQRDAVGLADKLELLILDKDLRIRLGKAAFEKYQQAYTLEHFEKRMLGIIQNIALELR